MKVFQKGNELHIITEEQLFINEVMDYFKELLNNGDIETYNRMINALNSLNTSNKE